MDKVFERQIDRRVRLDAEALEEGLGDLVSSASKLGISLDDKVVDPSSTDASIRACLAYLGVEAGTVPDGTKSLEERIEWLCRPSGTMYRSVRLDEGWSEHAYGALLACLDEDDPVALIPRNLHGYYYLDAQTGQRVPMDARTERRACGEAISFYKPLPARRLGPLDLAKFILGNFDRSDYTLVVTTCVAITLIGLLPAWVNQLAFDIVVPSEDPGLILPIATLLVGVVVARGLFGVCRSILTARIATKLDTTTEAATFARLLTLPAAFFKQYSSGDLSKRVSCMRSITQAVTSTLLGSSLTAALSLAYVFQIVMFAPGLLLPALVVIAIQIALSAMVVLGGMRYEQASLEEGARLSGLVTSLIAGIQKLKLAGAEDRALAKWSHAYAAYARVTYNRPLLLRVLPALVMTTGLVGTIVFYNVAARLQVSVAGYMAFSTAYGQATAAIMGLSKAAQSLAQIRPNYRMVAPILEAEPEVQRGLDGVDAIDGSVTMENVSFRYDEESPYVLRDLSLRVRPGEYVAFVGKSGCGKSTIVRLLLGFEKPEHGCVAYGRYDVSKVDLRSLRRQIGLVMQGGRLFSDSIFANITIATPQATLDDAWEAAEVACMADDIRKMPMGMQTIVSEGSGSFSGGQRQRILIARAVCGGRKILVFDEATSALDNRTQRHVSEALDALNCTRIVIAHRLSTVRHCDRILVLDEGHVVEEGSYEELIERKGLFADLVAKQRLEAAEPA